MIKNAKSLYVYNVLHHNAYKLYSVYRSMQNTTIQISIKTKEALEKLGKKGQTYDEIIQELLT